MSDAKLERPTSLGDRVPDGADDINAWGQPRFGVSRGLPRIEPEGATLVVLAAKDREIAENGDWTDRPAELDRSKPETRHATSVGRGQPLGQRIPSNCQFKPNRVRAVIIGDPHKSG